MIINFSQAPSWFINYLSAVYLDQLHADCVKAGVVPIKNKDVEGRMKLLNFSSDWFNRNGELTWVENTKLMFDFDDRKVTFAALKYNDE
jgi:hypothetical protein